MRFKEFTNEWEKTKLKTISEKVNRKYNEENKTIPIMMISYGNGFILQSAKYSKENTGHSLQNYTLLKKGEFSYNHGASKNKPYGVCYELIETNEARVPFVYHSFKIINGIPRYWNYALNTNIIDKQLKKLVSSGARMDGLLNISYDTYTSINISLPSNKEQQKIADFLTLIDQRIDTQSKIIEDLNLQIKWINNYIFNNIISINNYIFNNIISIKNSIYKFSELFKEYKKLNKNEYEQFTIGKYGIKKIDKESVKYSTKNHLVFEKNSLILGIGINEIGVSIDNVGCCSPIYKIYEINKKILYPHFAYYFIKNYFNKAKRFITQKSTRRDFEFDYKQIYKLDFKLPMIDEQEKIANELTKFFNKLYIENKILENLKEQKKYLLSNMFI